MQLIFTNVLLVRALLAGAMKLAVMDGPMYAHSNGLVFVSRPTKVHVMLLDQVRPGNNYQVV